MVAVAPKILAELNIEAPMVAKAESTSLLFSQLNLLIPDYMPKFIEKYGSDNWIEQDLKLLEEDKLINPKLYELCQNT